MNKYLLTFSAFILATIIAFFIVQADSGEDMRAVESASGAQGDQEAVLIKKGELNLEAKAKLLQNLSGDYYMGNPHAPVLMIEYASLTCPHCANFHEKVLDDLIVSHINTGKVRYIFRDFPLNKPALDASMLAMCAEKKNYFSFLKVLFKSQENWAFTPDYLAVLKNIAKLGGIPEDKFDGCLSNKANEEKILQTKKDAIEILEVSSTPTVFINGIVYEGKHTHEDVATYIDSLMKPSSN